jgi:hypothetical protein
MIQEICKGEAFIARRASDCRRTDHEGAEDMRI